MPLRIVENKYPSISEYRKYIQAKVDVNIRNLESIQAGFVVPTIFNEKLLLDKLVRIKKGEKIILSDYEQQCLSYNFYKLDNEDISFYLFTYLKEHWAANCINGLIHTILLKYHDIDLVSEIQNTLEKHERDFTSLQKIAFEYVSLDGGPKKLAQQLKRNRLQVDHAPSYVLGQKSIFIYPYFEDVMSNYFDENLDKDSMNLLKEALDKHDVRLYNQTLLPNLVLLLKQHINPLRTSKNALITLCNKCIGDYNDLTKWQVSGNVKPEINNNLISARNIIKVWDLEKKIFKVFEIAEGNVNYAHSRRRYWSEYAELLLRYNQNAPINTFFKVITSDAQLVREIYSMNIHTKSGNPSRPETAVLFKFGDYSVVDFLTGGCMYVYSRHDTKFSSIWRAKDHDSLKAQNLVELRHSDVNNRNVSSLKALTRLKIGHRGAWQDIFDNLLLVLNVRP